MLANIKIWEVEQRVYSWTDLFWSFKFTIISLIVNNNSKLDHLNKSNLFLFKYNRDNKIKTTFLEFWGIKIMNVDLNISMKSQNYECTNKYFIIKWKQNMFNVYFVIIHSQQFNRQFTKHLNIFTAVLKKKFTKLLPTSDHSYFLLTTQLIINILLGQQCQTNIIYHDGELEETNRTWVCTYKWLKTHDTILISETYVTYK